MALGRQGGGNGVRGDLAAIEGRMLVLEVVAMTSLAMVLDTSDEGNARIGKGVLNLIQEAVENKCREMGVSPTTADVAQSYVEELVSTALETLYPKQH